MPGDKVLSIQINDILDKTISNENLKQHPQYDKSIIDFTGEVLLDITYSEYVYRIRNRTSIVYGDNNIKAIYFNNFRLYESKIFNLSFKTTGKGIVFSSIVDINNNKLWEIDPSGYIGITGTDVPHTYAFAITPTELPMFYSFNIELVASNVATTYVEVKSLKLI